MQQTRTRCVTICHPMGLDQFLSPVGGLDFGSVTLGQAISIWIHLHRTNRWTSCVEQHGDYKRKPAKWKRSSEKHSRPTGRFAFGLSPYFQLHIIQRPDLCGVPKSVQYFQWANLDTQRRATYRHQNHHSLGRVAQCSTLVSHVIHIHEAWRSTGNFGFATVDDLKNRVSVAVLFNDAGLYVV
jgi:hypothetical protein